MMIKKRISAIVPCYNEEPNIIEMYQRLTRELARITKDWEIIFIDNGSLDNSYQIFSKLAREDKHVSVIVFSRNFYKSQGAYTAGIDFATGDCAVLLDGDIQDPPELIGKMVKLWQDGYEIVYGKRVEREGSKFRNFAYKLFYRILSKVSYIDIPQDAGDFSLIDRRVIEVMRQMPERDRYIRGLRAWVGFKSIGIAYKRAERKRGQTSNTFVDNIRWAILGIFSFSYVPLELISWLAVFTFIVSGVALVIYTVLYFVIPNAPRGFQTLLVSILFLGSIQLLALSIIAHYVGKIFEEVKSRPKYVIREVMNDHRRLKSR